MHNARDTYVVDPSVLLLLPLLLGDGTGLDNSLAHTRTALRRVVGGGEGVVHACIEWLIRIIRKVVKFGHHDIVSYSA